ncbi:MAG TPA: heme o synthase [Kofleriaceae bacterium]|nr:heme o synthase [Kofleriaceae bacterium]
MLTAAGAMSLSPGAPDAQAALWLLLGTGLIVGSANSLNMYLERDIDCLMARTKNRPLPTGQLAPRTALWFGLLLGAASLPALAILNLPTMALGLLALVAYVLVYTPLKQRTHWATWVGALPGALPVLMGWTAATGRVDLDGLVVFSVLFFWQIPHFHAIGMYRQLEYTKAGLKTLAGERGPSAARSQISLYLVVQVAVSLLLTPMGIAGTPYLVVAAALGVMVFAQAYPALLRGRADARWARSLFLASIVYLPVLFVTMVLDGRM